MKRSRQASPSHHRGQWSGFRNPGEQGTTLVELLVSLAILVVVLVGVLVVFDMNSRMARVQTDVADMQQALRAVQYEMVRTVRMAGRAPLPAYLDTDDPTVFPGKPLPKGVAVEVLNNVDPGTKMGGASGAPEVVEGTDVLIIRGVLSTPIYQANPGVSMTVDDETNPTTGDVTLSSRTTAGVDQDLEPLKDVAVGEALVLVSPIVDSIYAVVEVTGVTVTATDARIDFQVQGGSYTTEYLALSPAGRFPPELKTVAYVGILEEYRYYVRKLHAIPIDPSSQLTPTLARARFFPGTDIAYGTTTAEQAANLREDLADNIFDLQIALGIDRNRDGVIELGPDPTTVDPENDDWLFNHENDKNTLDDLDGMGRLVWGENPLFYIRINTLARTDRRDRGFVATALEQIEDRSYGEPVDPPDEAARQERMFRRRVLQTVADMRNLA